MHGKLVMANTPCIVASEIPVGMMHKVHHSWRIGLSLHLNPEFTGRGQGVADSGGELPRVALVSCR